MYRAVFRYWEEGKTIKPESKGMRVVRRFYLLAENGSRRREIKAGDTIELEVPLAPYRAEEVTRRMTLRVPAGTPPGPRKLVVGDSSAAAQMRTERNRFILSSLSYFIF